MSVSTGVEQITCAFCKGQGVDPFGIMSPLSTCGGCGGSGVRDVPVHRVPCNFCHGTGSDKTYRCPACDGTGVLPAADPPTELCPECGGRSYVPSSGLVCLTCKGHGLVHVDRHSSHKRD